MWCKFSSSLPDERAAVVSQLSAPNDLNAKGNAAWRLIFPADEKAETGTPVECLHSNCFFSQLECYVIAPAYKVINFPGIFARKASK